jgi:hypothetical protein
MVQGVGVLDTIGLAIRNGQTGTIEILRDNKMVVRYTFRDQSYLCGYVEFPKSRIPKCWWDDFTAEGLKYLRIHGGITHVATDEISVVFGMDCAHAGDGDRPELRDPEHVYQLVKDMEIVIATYADRIQEWRAASPHDRMAIIDAINGLAMIREGFGTPALIDMMQGAPTFRQIDPFERVRERPVHPSLFRRIVKWLKDHGLISS